MARVPLRRFYAESMVSPMSVLISGAAGGNQQLEAMGWTGRCVLGFKLPSWQRAAKWTDDQCVNFIESVYLGANIGQFMVNLTANPETDRILIDGQQRLRALERYLADEFGVPGEDGVPVAWSELADGERAHLYRIGFPWLATSYPDDATLREAYNRHCFGGTAHSTAEMADVGDFRHAETGFRAL